MRTWHTIAVLISLGIPATGFGQCLRPAPINPAFVKFQAEQSLRAGQTIHPGVIPTPTDLRRMQAQRPALPAAARALPATYDLREHGRMTPVRDQTPYGTCWAFASYASFESCLLPAENRFFSVNNLANRHGFDFGYNDGGNHAMATAYLARWDGPVNAADDPYPNPGHTPAYTPLQKHITMVAILPRTNTLDDAYLKYGVMNYGGLYVAMFWDSAFYNPATKAFYDYSTTSHCNHAVCMAGWDDNFSRTNFLVTPPGDGAYLLKNSWSANFADQGYFYISYYDSNFWGGVAFAEGASADDCDANYQYDPFGQVTSFGYDGPVAWGANIFTATSAVRLCAVGVHAIVANTSYEIFICTDVAPTNPASGLLRARQSGLMDFAGYQAVPLQTPVPLASGQRFAVIVRFHTPNYQWPIPAEMAFADYCSAASAAPGQSFHSWDGIHWGDMTYYNGTLNATIKGLGQTCAAIPAPLTSGGDYDGDGRADPVLAWIPDGTWKVKLSATSYAVMVMPEWLGAPGARAAAADFDGDGRADPYLYHPDSGSWRICFSGADFMPVDYPGRFGAPDTQPASADYDGDGKADPALYIPDSGAWMACLSSHNYQPSTYTNWPRMTGSLAVAADYDGDGKADPCLYQPSDGINSGNWLILLSSRQTFSHLTDWCGGMDHDPAPADYDGDGKADPAAVQSSTGRWFIRLSTTDYQLLALDDMFGVTTSTPD